MKNLQLSQLQNTEIKDKKLNIPLENNNPIKMTYQQYQYNNEITDKFETYIQRLNMTLSNFKIIDKK